MHHFFDVYLHRLVLDFEAQYEEWSPEDGASRAQWAEAQHALRGAGRQVFSAIKTHLAQHLHLIVIGHADLPQPEASSWWTVPFAQQTRVYSHDGWPKAYEHKEGQVRCSKRG